MFFTSWLYKVLKRTVYLDDKKHQSPNLSNWRAYDSNDDLALQYKFLQISSNLLIQNWFNLMVKTYFHIYFLPPTQSSMAGILQVPENSCALKTSSHMNNKM